MVCNCRSLLFDSQWTQLQSHLGHKSIIVYNITDKALMKALSNVLVEDRTDVGSSDHYLVWFELGKTFGRNKKKQSAFCIDGE